MRVVILDDQSDANEALSSVLRLQSGIETSEQSPSAGALKSLMGSNNADVVFADAGLAWQGTKCLVDPFPRGQLPLVIFVSRTDRYAAQAFDLRAFDYLLKPYDIERCQQSIRRARAEVLRMRGFDQDAVAAAVEAIRGRSRYRFSIRTGGRIQFVPADSVDWIQSEHSYVRLHAGSEIHQLRAKLSDLQEKLDREQFRRIHRSTIVNVNRIQEMHPWFRGDYVVILQGGQRLAMSRTYRKEMADLLP